MPRHETPGFERENTEVIVPLAKNIVLLGRFEGTSNRLYTFKKQVAGINSLSIIYAHRFIYSSRKNIDWLNKDGRIGNTEDIIDEFREKNVRAGNS